MTKSILLLRVSYWLAAISDFVIAILFWMPERMGLNEIAYPMGLASVVAFSWSVMLVIADRKPFERRWILIPTILVISLIAIIRTAFSLTGNIEFSMTLLLFALSLIGFLTYSLIYANKQASEKQQ